MSESFGDLVETITMARFTPVRLRHEGYDMGEVDDLLDRIVAALGAGEPVTPLLEGVRLTHVRLREGYNIDEVDKFLDQVRRAAQR